MQTHFCSCVFTFYLHPQGNLDLSPWLYVIPSDLAPFRELLLQLGAAPAFSAAQYRQLLQDMYRQSLRQTAAGGGGGDESAAAGAGTGAATTHLNSNSNSNTNVDQAGGGCAATPLSERQLGQAIAAIQALAELPAASPGAQPPPSLAQGQGQARTGSAGGAVAGGGAGSAVGAAVELYAPDDRGTLCPLQELAFNDAPWLGSTSVGAVGGAVGIGGVDGGLGQGPRGLPLGVKLVHPLISNLVAER